MIAHIISATIRGAATCVSRNRIPVALPDDFRQLPHTVIQMVVVSVQVELKMNIAGIAAIQSDASKNSNDPRTITDVPISSILLTSYLSASQPTGTVMSVPAAHSIPYTEASWNAVPPNAAM
jgi:hypothetical protein